jgi:hypothetical protein
MNWKKFLIAFIVLYILSGLIGFVVHEVLLADTYEALSDVWRPRAEMESLMWTGWITTIIFIFFFIYIFAKGREGKGIIEGLRYGLIIWAFMTIPNIYMQYMVYPLPYSLILQWLIYDLITFLIMGAVVSLLYNPDEVKKEAA